MAPVHLQFVVVPTGPPSRDSVVVRFKPIDPVAVLKRAVLEQRRTAGTSPPGHHGLSVFVVSTAGRSHDAAVTRAIEVAELDGIRPKQKCYVTTVGNLLDLGFVFLKDEDPGELDEHYCVSLGAEPDLADVERFLQAFSEREQ